MSIKPVEERLFRPIVLRIFTNSQTGGREAIIRINSLTFTDETWAQEYGSIENEVLQSEVRHLTIDLKSCRWFDPIPLLSLLLLANNKICNNCIVEITLATPRSPSSKLKILTRNPRLESDGSRALRYLLREGFLDCFRKIGAKVCISVENKKITTSNDSEIEVILSEGERVAYHNSKAIKASIIKFGEFDTNTRRRINDSISEQLNNQKFQELIQAKVDARHRDELLARLRVILIEGLTNIAEHAYAKNVKGAAGVYYVRYRKGIPGANQSEREQLKLFLSQEHNSSPKLDPSYLLYRRGCLEVYIGDIGCGLVEKLAKSHPELLDKKYPLRYYLERVLLDGLSSNTIRRTAKGALSLIYTNGSRYGDYLRAHSAKTWFGTGAPLTRSSATTELSTGKSGTIGPTGLFWQFRIGWGAPVDADTSWHATTHTTEPQNSSGPVNPIADAYKRKPSKIVLDAFSKVVVIHGRVSNQIENQYTQTNRTTNSDRKIVLWYAETNLLKNEILVNVERIAKQIPERIEKLYIIDIERNDAEFYLGALQDMKTDTRKLWPSQISSITLITATWKVCVLDYTEWKSAKTEGVESPEDAESIRHGFAMNSLATKAFFNVGMKNGSPSIFEVVDFMRLSASRDFWRLVSRHSSNQSLYYAGPVQWSEVPPISINGYLDFGQVTLVNACQKILIRELKRYWNIFFNKLPKLYSFDSYVGPLVEQVEWTMPETSISDLHRLGVGSILVTGSTISAHRAQPSSYVHFLAHPYSGEKFNAPATLLMWPIDETWFEKRFPPRGEERKRIGSTAAISNLGNKTYSIPRFDRLGNSIAFRDPAFTYAEIQDQPSLIQSGHWSDGAHHDLITLNVRKSILRSDILGDGVLNYIAACLISSLNLESQLTEIGAEKYRTQMAIMAQRTEFNQNACAVVYPTQGDAGLLVELFKERYLPEDRHEEVEKKLIGISNLRNNAHKLPILLTPSTAERIERAIIGSNKSHRNVIILDDAIITGKTQSDLRSILRDLGATGVHTLTALDRQRLPGNRERPENFNAYWRLDLPPLGDSFSCPICGARNELDLVASLLSSTQLIQHIKEVRDRWRVSDPNRDWDRALQPISFKPIEIRYGLQSTSESEKTTIALRNSAAAALWYIEIESMTGTELALERILNKLTNIEPKSSALTSLAKLELLASAALYFRSNLTPTKLLTIIELIFQEIVCTPNSGDHTSFGAIAIISTIEYIKQSSLTFFESLVDKYVDDDSELLSDDSRMLIATLLARGAISTSTQKVSQVARLLLGRQLSLADRYNLFHGELLSPLGTLHGRPLACVGEGVKFSSAERPALVREAIDSCDFLTNFIQTIQAEYIFIQPRQNETVDNRNVHSLPEKIQLLLADAKEGLLKLDNNATEISRIQPTCFKLIQALSELRCQLAIDLKRTEITLKSLFETITTEWPKSISKPNCNLAFSHIESKISLRPGEERWIAWDSQIRLMISDILKNCISRAHIEITNPYGPPSAKKSKIWMHVVLGDQSITIRVANSIDPNHSKRGDALEIKGRIRFRRIREIGGDVQRVESADNLFDVSIIIPYLGFCKQLIQGENNVHHL